MDIEIVTILLSAALDILQCCRSQEACCSPGSDCMCCVCLDSFEEDVELTRLPCKHSFHSSCIHPWLQQQGLKACCPLCKAAVWPQKSQNDPKADREVSAIDIAVTVYAVYSLFHFCCLPFSLQARHMQLVLHIILYCHVAHCVCFCWQWRKPVLV